MYQLVNFFVPAVVFVTALHKCQIFDFNFFGEPWFVQITLLYIIGITFSRFGSLIVQPCMEILRIIKMSDYNKYVKYSDDAIKKMQCTANEYRTYVGVFFILHALQRNNMTLILLWTFLTILFALAYKKQIDFIQQRLVYNYNKEAVK